MQEKLNDFVDEHRIKIADASYRIAEFQDNKRKKEQRRAFWRYWVPVIISVLGILVSILFAVF